MEDATSDAPSVGSNRSTTSSTEGITSQIGTWMVSTEEAPRGVLPAAAGDSTAASLESLEATTSTTPRQPTTDTMMLLAPTPPLPTSATKSASEIRLVHKELSATKTTAATLTTPHSSSTATMGSNSERTHTSLKTTATATDEEGMSIDTTHSSSSSPSRKKKRALQSGQTQGRWTDSEHQAFLKGLSTYGREWKKVAAHIPTRTSAQVRSHAQKYFAKLQRDQDQWLVSSSSQQQSSSASNAGSTDWASGLSPSVQAEAERILSEPETVQAEVQDTLEQLRNRYRQLQEQLAARQDDLSMSSAGGSSHHAVEEDELIAVHVLQGGISHNSGTAEDSSSLSTGAESKGGGATL